MKGLIARSFKYWLRQLNGLGTIGTHICFVRVPGGSAQDSTCESPFFLLYGRDPTLATLSREPSLYTVDLRTDLVSGLSSAWRIAHDFTEKSQERQKTAYDKFAKETTLEVGQRVMVYMPGEVQGKTWKFARPYQVFSITPTNAEVQLVDEPKSESIFVLLNRVGRCRDELPDQSWRGSHPTARYTPRQPVGIVAVSNEVPYTGANALNQDCMVADRGHPPPLAALLCRER